MKPEEPATWEEMNAYLDGELDLEARRRVESRLAKDAAYAAQFQKLERAWHALDNLPQSSVGIHFAETTIQMVTRAAESELIEPPHRKKRSMAWLSIAGGAIAAGLLGAFVGQKAWPDPNKELLQDLPVLEHYDALRQLDSLEFLVDLHKSGVFADEDSHD